MVKKEIAIFAGGCFWHIEDVFCNIPGVLKTTVGYTGGKTKNPTYKEVCSGKTEHAEAIEIIFDANKINYEDLLEIFWKAHNPTTLNRQGFDFGSNYRSAIFYNNEKQKKIALESKEKAQKNFKREIVTEIVKASKFYPAEEYHQKYTQKHGGSCKI